MRPMPCHQLIFITIHVPTYFLDETYVLRDNYANFVLTSTHIASRRFSNRYLVHLCN